MKAKKATVEKFDGEKFQAEHDARILKEAFEILDDKKRLKRAMAEIDEEQAELKRASEGIRAKLKRLQA